MGNYAATVALPTAFAMEPDDGSPPFAGCSLPEGEPGMSLAQRLARRAVRTAVVFMICTLQLYARLLLSAHHGTC